MRARSSARTPRPRISLILGDHTRSLPVRLAIFRHPRFAPILAVSPSHYARNGQSRLFFQVRKWRVPGSGLDLPWSAIWEKSDFSRVRSENAPDVGQQEAT